MTQWEIEKANIEAIRRIQDLTDDICNACDNILTSIDDIADSNKQLVYITSNERREYQKNLRVAYEQLKNGKYTSLSYPIGAYETIVLELAVDYERTYNIIIYYTDDIGERAISMPIAAFEFMLVVLGV